ncbi:Bug family tripartite tricarboxylate transporter substrate binding protein [Pollutimonas subterranea]|nr:tripartite tricarboxylate transporter substrate binding protein [Pollutimonas subterranea]
MKFVKKTIKIAAVCIGALGTCTTMAAEAKWPQRPVTLIVPFSPGGSTDITARIVAEGLRAQLGQPVIVENKAGAGGNIGAAYVAQSKPDGYTYLFATNAHAAAVTLYESVNYDFQKDLAPVAQIVSFPNVLVVPATSPAKSLEEFIDYAKAAPQPLNYGSAGIGSSHHLATALFEQRIGAKMQHVPFKGGSPANLAILSGQIDANVAPLMEVYPSIQGGKLRALGVTTSDRADLLPNAPAIGEVLDGYEVTLWSGIMAPSGTSEQIQQAMNEAVRKALKSPAIATQLKDLGYKIYDEALEDLGPMYEREVKNWGEMVRVSGAKAN